MKRYVGIVGSEARKFTDETERIARREIRRLICHADVVVSGACPLGGIDEWAIEEAKRDGKRTIQHPPKVLRWYDGYRPRNLKIAEDSDEVYCITVRELPPSYRGMRFDFCYHCGTDEHVKSGGCWTTKKARELGKVGETIVIG